MPMLVRVEAEPGSVLSATSDVQDVLTSLAEKESGRLAIAHTIDPWGHTVLNRLQIPLLLQDIGVLSSVASQEERQKLEEIAALAHRSLDEPHLYLKFYGD
jgi:hypothetical protein